MEEKITILWTDKAKADLRTIFDYYCLETSEKIAHQMIHKLLKKTTQLSKNPKSGAVEPYLGHLKFEYRRLVEGHYKIIYRIQDTKVFINRVFDSRQNPYKLKVK